jgi:hypothetical protein
MILILILVAVALAAYYLARRDVDKKTVEATRGISSKAIKVGGDLQNRVRDLTGQNQGKPEDFIAWVTGPGKQDLPEDFSIWFASLDGGEKKSFSKALANYVDGLGMSLAALTSGRLNQQPDFKSVFVETLVIYSSAYRKIAEAKEKTESTAEESEAKNASDAPVGEIQPAEKARSRRGSESPMEAAPAAS